MEDNKHESTIKSESVIFKTAVDELCRKDTDWHGIAVDLVRSIRSNKLSHAEYSMLAAIQVAVLGEDIAALDKRIDTLEKTVNLILRRQTS